MAVFRSHREARRATNRTLVRFYSAMAVLTLTFVLIVAAYYLVR